jgi:trimeric autotransporter adhesin
LRFSSPVCFFLVLVLSLAWAVFCTGNSNSPNYGRLKIMVARSTRRSSVRSKLRVVEVLESRELLATFAVTNLHNSGAGSFRQAIIDSNGQPGGNTIDFDVAGTIRISQSSLPAITAPVIIDGSTAPSFAGSPVVTVNFQGFKGLNFAAGSDGSTLKSLSLIKAGNAGVTLNASLITVQGNFIGLQTDGKTAAGNRGDGVQINASSHGDLIGQSDPVSSIDYSNSDALGIQQPVSGWQGIRNSDTSGQYLIAGTSDANGLLYEGPISGGGTGYDVDYPGATTTSVYGPDDLGGGLVRLVGAYKTGDGIVQGFVFQGTTADLSNSSDYQTIDYPNAQYTYVHSTMGDLAVGNADGPEGNAPIGTGHAFLYDVATSSFLTDIIYPGSTSTTAYGIWYNGGTSYTIAGGYTDLLQAGKTLAQAYLVSYDSATGQFTNWTSYADPNGLAGQALATHFQGISSTEKGVYTLGANSAQAGSSTVLQAEWATVRLNPDGTFGPATWVTLSYPGVQGSPTADAVQGNQVVGIVLANTGVFSYQATVNVGFQLSNVISANGGNGIGIYGASGNQIAMNDIGTDASGTLGRGNAKNGILVTDGATGNIIGGQATGGNDPTNNVFVRPPQGNLISANGANGVLIDDGVTQTLLSGNFVGTTASGDSALGNRQDGVAIVGANGNQLIGCTFQQDPFVFYNVLSGNGGNGLRITNSNDTTVQANFMGVGANNATIVANGGNGLLVSGSSANTQVGGVIPLGNVISGNNGNGIEVTDTASGFTSFNTFAGTYAFGAAAPNKKNGILVMSTGGNNLIRTCIVSGNLGNGIELGCDATGVQITNVAVGTNSDIQTAIPNDGSGILITGHAHNNAIGGFQPSVEPQNTVSANRRYGIQIVGSANNNVIFNTVIGTNAQGTAPLGNVLGGVYLGSGTSSTTIGGTAAPFQNKILDSVSGAGVIIKSSSGNTVVGNDIQNNATDGIMVIGGQDNQIGSTTGGNIITGNGQDGLYVSGVVTGTAAEGNQIDSNTGNGVTLAQARGVTIGGSSAGTVNQIVSNQGYGVYAFGISTGSVVQHNVIAENTAGDVNLTKASGITFIP